MACLPRLAAPRRLRDDPNSFIRLIRRICRLNEMVSAVQSRVAEQVIESIEDPLSDAILEQLYLVFSEPLLLAALDLVDQECIVKTITPWGHTEYSVNASSSAATYLVFIGLPDSRKPHICTCPAYSYSVLLSDSHVTCKHILAVRISEKLGNCGARMLENDEELARLIVQQACQ
ncbi:hypothetical protein BD626DRAFT_474453 [Schizophyllum amplum]|uniref:SWIM-type domain-containing protein n=1 Tax=Schizophyllum amplum TaxID=97359 RepID=A0A550CXM2_9AGAR|nr:hypothetical protein BD626DRAFT_474453 [Auriculariopsis ampla]